MIQVAGTYFQGHIALEKEILVDKPVKVLLTFIDDLPINSQKQLKISDFGFKKAQKLVEDYNGSLSDEVIKERRSYL